MQHWWHTTEEECSSRGRSVVLSLSLSPSLSIFDYTMYTYHNCNACMVMNPPYRMYIQDIGIVIEEAGQDDLTLCTWQHNTTCTGINVYAPQARMYSYAYDNTCQYWVAFVAQEKNNPNWKEDWSFEYFCPLHHLWAVAALYNHGAADYLVFIRTGHSYIITL